MHNFILNQMPYEPFLGKTGNILLIKCWGGFPQASHNPLPGVFAYFSQHSCSYSVRFAGLVV